jgi:hypothetical protein
LYLDSGVFWIGFRFGIGFGLFSPPFSASRSLEQYAHWTAWYQSRSIIHLFTIREWIDYVTTQLKKPRLSIQGGASVAKVLLGGGIV